MIRLRNLDLGSGKFNGAMYKGTLSFPFTTETPILDLSGVRHSRAGGWTGLYYNIRHETNIMTGDSQVLRLRAEQNTAATGQLRALQAQAAMIVNGGTGASLQAATLEALAKGKNVTTLRGVEIIADNTEGTGTITDIRGARVRVIGAAATLSGSVHGLEIVDDAASASAAPQAFTSFIRCEKTGSGTATQLIDASAAALTLHDTDQVTLIKFKDAAGTVKTMSYDTSGNALVFA